MQQDIMAFCTQNRRNLSFPCVCLSACTQPSGRVFWGARSSVKNEATSACVRLCELELIFLLVVICQCTLRVLDIMILNL